MEDELGEGKQDQNILYENNLTNSGPKWYFDQHTAF